MLIRLLLLFVSINSSLLAQTLTLHFTGVRSNAGSIRIQFFDNKENFDKEKPLFTKTAFKTGLKNGEFTISYSDVKPGTYGIAILDDENNNQKMDYGLLLPKEGFGFSDYYHSGMTRPDFHRFVFTLGNTPRRVEIKLRYM